MDSFNGATDFANRLPEVHWRDGYAGRLVYAAELADAGRRRLRRGSGRRSYRHSLVSGRDKFGELYLVDGDSLGTDHDGADLSDRLFRARSMAASLRSPSGAGLTALTSIFKSRTSALCATRCRTGR